MAPSTTNSKPTLNTLISVTRASSKGPHTADLVSSSGRPLLSCSGPTRDDAVNTMFGAIRAAFEGSYRPRILSWRGIAYLLWRSAQDSWVHVARLDLNTGTINDTGTFSYTTWEEAENTISFHIAQQGWNMETDTDPAFVPDIVSDQRRNEFQGWTRWQRRYQELAAEGLSESDIGRRLFDECL